MDEEHGIGGIMRVSYNHKRMQSATWDAREIMVTKVTMMLNGSGDENIKRRILQYWLTQQLMIDAKRYLQPGRPDPVFPSAQASKNSIAPCGPVACNRLPTLIVSLKAVYRTTTSVTEDSIPSPICCKG